MEMPMKHLRWLRGARLCAVLCNVSVTSNLAQAVGRIAPAVTSYAVATNSATGNMVVTCTLGTGAVEVSA